jgi:uncharacterized protein
MKIKSGNFLRSLTRFVLRQAVLVSVLGTLLALVGSFYTVLLYKNLRTNIEELLPSTARSVVDLARLGKQVKSVENLVVLTFSANTQASKRFVIDLAAKLDALPKTMVAGVEYRIDGELEFFRKKRLLFVQYDDLVNLKKYVQSKILYEKDRRILGLGLISEPKFDFESLKKKYSNEASFFDRFPDGFYASPDQTKRVIIVNLPGGAADIDAALRLRKAVETTVASLNPTSYSADLQVRYTGNTENLIEEHAALISDLKFTTVIVILLVAGAMLVFYRTFWSPFALVLSVLMGTLWTMGISYFLTGYLNANSAFLASIVIGNGINFGIIFLARYLEERRHARGHTRALVIAMKTTSKPTLTAALAAGISYGSLMLTDFRGFNQFGVIGLCGMVLCWISAYTILPSFLTVLEKWVGLLKKGAPEPRPFVSGALAKLVERHPRSIAGLSLCLTLAAFVTFFVHKPQIMELDMNKLRDRTSMQSGSGFYYHYISDIFGKNLSPMVLLPNSREEARQIAAALREKKEKEGEASEIAWVQTLDDLVPPDQEKKIALIKDFRKTLTPAVMKIVPPEYREIANEVADSKGLTPFLESDLSPTILGKFTEADGKRGRIVLVDKPVVGAGQEENALVTVTFVKNLRSVVDQISPGTAIAGQLPITADMVSAILQDGPKATLFACLAVFLLVAILFRNMRMIVLVSFTLWIGVCWLAGLVLGLNIKINVLNFIALPITFGIGVDYGVNVFQRYREGGMRSILDAIRYTGAAVGLCSLTTVIGYTSLILASNQAFVSFGKLAALGEVCCVTVAIVYLPAYLLTHRPRTS